MITSKDYPILSDNIIRKDTKMRIQLNDIYRQTIPSEIRIKPVVHSGRTKNNKKDTVEITEYAKNMILRKAILKMLYSL